VSLDKRLTRLESGYGAEEHEPAQIILVRDPNAKADLGPPPADVLESLVTQLNQANPRATIHMIIWDGDRLLSFGHWAREVFDAPTL